MIHTLYVNAMQHQLQGIESWMDMHLFAKESLKITFTTSLDK